MKKEKMNDKGFSLVELIIVIAIMAVLVVVLAPQYLKYVERSRNSTDLSNATAIATAFQVYAADPEAKPAFQVGYKFKVAIGDTASADAVTETVPAGGTCAGAAAKALSEAAIDTSSLTCKSKSNWTAYAIEGTVAADGHIDFTYSSTHTTDEDEFAKGMTK